MKGKHLVKKLVLRSSDDLLAATCEQTRREKGDVGGASWQQVVRSARAEGIFAEAEAGRFLRLVSDEQGDACRAQQR